MRRTRVSRWVIALLTAGPILLSGCSENPSPARNPTPEVSSVTTVRSSQADLVDDPPGTRTCALLAAAIADGSLMDATVVDGIAGAVGTADAPVADAADRLAGAYAAAVAARDKPDEPDAVAAVSAAAADMSGVCADSGLRSAG